MIQIKTFFLFQGNPQNNDQILNLQIAWNDKHNNFYEPVTPTYRDQRQTKQIINKENRHNSYHALVT